LTRRGSLTRVPRACQVKRA